MCVCVLRTLFVRFNHHFQTGICAGGNIVQTGSKPSSVTLNIRSVVSTGFESTSRPQCRSLCPHSVCPARLGGAVKEPAISGVGFRILSSPSLLSGTKCNVFILLCGSVLLGPAAGRGGVTRCIPPGVSGPTVWTSSSSGAKKQLLFPLLPLQVRFSSTELLLTFRVRILCPRAPASGHRWLSWKAQLHLTLLTIFWDF